MKKVSLTAIRTLSPWWELVNNLKSPYEKQHKKLLVLLSALVERFNVSCMQDFFLFISFYSNIFKCITIYCYLLFFFFVLFFHCRFLPFLAVFGVNFFFYLFLAFSCLLFPFTPFSTLLFFFLLVSYPFFRFFCLFQFRPVSASFFPFLPI